MLESGSSNIKNDIKKLFHSENPIESEGKPENEHIADEFKRRETGVVKSNLEAGIEFIFERTNYDESEMDLIKKVFDSRRDQIDSLIDLIREDINKALSK